MNRYDHQFAAVCPSDGASIIYHLAIKSETVILAEDIVTACTFDGPRYHEALADHLSERLGGSQKLRAMHQGVHITTTRKPLPPESPMTSEVVKLDPKAVEAVEPCPGCGRKVSSEPRDTDGDGVYFMRCDHCGWRGPYSYSLVDAFNNWQRRAAKRTEAVAWVVIDQNGLCVVPEQYVEAIRAMFDGPPIEINGRTLKKAARLYATPPASDREAVAWAYLAQDRRWHAVEPILSSIDAAIALVERALPHNPWRRWFAAGGDEDDGNNYSFDLRYGSGEDDMSTASARTLPLAIILALLRSLPSEGKQP